MSTRARLLSVGIGIHLVSKFAKVLVWRGREDGEGLKGFTGGLALGDGAMCPSPMWE